MPVTDVVSPSLSTAPGAAALGPLRLVSTRVQAPSFALEDSYALGCDLDGPAPKAVSIDATAALDFFFFLDLEVVGAGGGGGTSGFGVSSFSFGLGAGEVSSAAVDSSPDVARIPGIVFFLFFFPFLDVVGLVGSGSEDGSVPSSVGLGAPK